MSLLRFFLEHRGEVVALIFGASVSSRSFDRHCASDRRAARHSAYAQTGLEQTHLGLRQHHANRSQPGAYSGF